MIWNWLVRRARSPRRIRWTPGLVARFWNGVAQTRLMEFGFSKQAARSLIIAVDHLLPREGTVLDFGAGDGYLIQLLCEREVRVAGFEPSANRRRVLHRRLDDCPGFLGVLDAKSPGSFDMVVMAEVIEHVLDEEIETVLGRIAKFARPGGILVVTTPNNEDLELGMAYCPVSNTLFHRWQHVRSFTRESLCALLEQYGFDEVVTHHVDFNDALYVPSDPLWGEGAARAELPSFVQTMRLNLPTRMGSESNLLYIGRRRQG